MENTQKNPKYLTNIKSYYSIRQSTMSIDDIINEAKKQNANGFVLCDRNMLGVKEAYDKCKKNNLKLIVGLEVPVLDGQIKNDKINDKKSEKKNEKRSEKKITLIAKNNDGYKELIKISTDNELENNVTVADIVGKKNVIKVISGETIEELRDNAKTIADCLNQFKKNNSGVFNIPSEFYLGYSDAVDYNEYIKVNNDFFNGQLDIIEFNPKRSNSKEGLDTLKLITEFQKESFSTTDSQLINTEINAKTVKEINQINFDNFNVLIENEDVLPKFDDMNETNAYEKLAELVKKGLREKYTPEELKTQVPVRRAAEELKVIKNMGFCNYFLIVNDYVNWAKENNIEVGPGRGSAAGSIVAYTTGITEIDPLKYGLIFERFLNPERVTMPDIDVDFESGRRQEVIDHIIEKYGKGYAAQIITFTMYGFKVAANDIAKASGLSVAQANEVKKLMPETSKTEDDFSCVEYYKKNKEFKFIIDKYNLKDKLAQIDYLARMPRGLGTHAGGVVISGTPLSNVVPLIESGGNVKNVQYSKKYIESVGLLKMDILAVDNLSKFPEILKMIDEEESKASEAPAEKTEEQKSDKRIEHEVKKPKIDWNKIDLNDPEVYKLINSLDTAGVFQLDTHVAKETIKQMQCNNFNDLVAVISLGRPGPMENLPEFCARKNGKKKIEYDIPELEPILKETHGIIVFQEQVMRCATDLAGMSMAKADEMRRAMSSKNLKILEEMKTEFVDGCVKNNITKENAEKVYSTMEKFASYGFNKSHAVCYAMVAYRLAYLKTHYPKEFYSSLLNHSSKKPDIIANCKKKNIKILPPEINIAKDVSVITKDAIVLPITEIKGVGEAAANAIINERNKNGPFENIVDFVERLEPKTDDTGKKSRNQLTEKVYSSLVKAGSLDCFGYNRTTLLKNYQEIKSFIENKKLMMLNNNEFELTSYTDDIERNIANEKAVLDVNLKLNPINIIKDLVKFPYEDINKLNKKTKEREIQNDQNNRNGQNRQDNQKYKQSKKDKNSNNVTLVGEIVNVKEIIDRNGNYMAHLTVKDDTGSIKTTVFANDYKKYRENLVKGNYVAVKGQYSNNEKYGASIAVQKMARIILPSFDGENENNQQLNVEDKTKNNDKGNNVDNIENGIENKVEIKKNRYDLDDEMEKG